MKSDENGNKYIEQHLDKMDKNHTADKNEPTNEGKMYENPGIYFFRSEIQYNHCSQVKCLKTTPIQTLSLCQIHIYIINTNTAWLSYVCIVDQDIFIDISPGCNVHIYNMVMFCVQCMSATWS